MKNHPSSVATTKTPIFSLSIATVVWLTIASFGCTPPGIPKPKGETKADADAKRKRELLEKRKCILTSTRRQNIVDTIHGVSVADPYRWLENGKTEETKSWLNERDTCTRKYLSTLPGKTQIRQRLEKLNYFDKMSAPSHKGKRFFYSRRHADKEKSVYYWKEGEAGEEKILLDPNTMSTDGTLSLKGIYISYDGKWAAYKVSKNNADSASLHLMEVATGKESTQDTIPGCKYASAEWDKSGKGFYYTRLPQDKTIKADELPGYAEIYYHKIGTDYKKDRLVHGKTGDPRKFIFPQTYHDGRYLVVSVMFGWANVDVYYKDLRGGSKFRTLVKNSNAMYQVEYYKGSFYVLTNATSPRYSLFKVNPNRPARKLWKEIVKAREGAVLQNVAVIGGNLALTYLEKASSRAEVADLKGKKIRDVELPGIGSTRGLHGSPIHDEAYYSFSTFTNPPTIYKTSIKKGGSSLYSKVKLPFTPDSFTTDQVEYYSKDGTKVTMFIIRKKEFKKDGTTPFILYGYGGFNISETPRFSPSRILWLERGGAIAIPNLRGGGEYGEDWHKSGMLSKKQNVFDDFIAAAKYLIDKKYTSASRLAIRGGSNGGLLVGAAMVQAPNLFKAVSCHVPLLDMVRYHKFGSGKTWIAEYGSADKVDQFHFLYAYSPYHHVTKGTKYPALLMNTADSDDRVDPMHARKFVAMIEYAQGSSANPVFLRLEKNAGHGGGDMVKKKVAAATDEYLFLMDQLGMISSEKSKAPTPASNETDD
ncbi:prolyl oligopeptidase family serine peptidase [Myxococcota bacterium]|nr:prolyl oligopeptidase family serine peptidase [Myxococcota bacterium]MBU1535293.1 prolyl oligopeptidase family serine peptidase [Myxococcota bacterium]